MVIITNPGSNLPSKVVSHYGIVLTPQRIMVDGVEHSTLEQFNLRQIDEWVKTAKEYPYVIGTTAAEAAEAFRHGAKTTPELIAIMTSKKIIGSHTAALAAARALSARDPRLSIAVIDTKTTDLGAGMCALFAAEAARRGHRHADVVAATEAFAEQICTLVTFQTLEYAVKGGRAGVVRAWLAKVLDVTPFLGFANGEAKVVAKAPARGDVLGVFADRIATTVGAGRAVWLAIAHGEAPQRALEAAEKLKKVLDVRYLVVRRLSASIYLHTGPGTVFAVACPIDRLPWTPTAPIEF